MTARLHRWRSHETGPGRACNAAMGGNGSIYEVQAADGTKTLLKGRLPLDGARQFPTRRLRDSKRRSLAPNDDISFVRTSRSPTPVHSLTVVSVDGRCGRLPWPWCFLDCAFASTIRNIEQQSKCIEIPRILTIWIDS